MLEVPAMYRHDEKIKVSRSNDRSKGACFANNCIIHIVVTTRYSDQQGSKSRHTVPSPTLFELPLCHLPSIYINKDEPHLYTNISKVYLASLRPYKTILLLLL